MSIEQVVSNAVVEKDGIHFLSDHAKFGYNDGDRIESYILNVIRNAKDISSDSRELETHIRDWPSLYHFSRERSLAYQSLNITRDMRVLEVGCGCGSITRLLGERSDHVVALEGSPRRATITRARTRNLNSVTVLCASFEDVKFTQQFDLVVCNGVLEYASLFVKHENPHRRMIELLSALVAPGGSLVVAIENKLGLRYFSSSTEDHTGVMYDGLEGYPRKVKGPKTFGLTELRGMLSSQFSEVEALLPLPDYKLPSAVIRERFTKAADCAELLANTARHDFGAWVQPKLHERMVWRELQSSGLAAEMSNSLIMVASHGAGSLLDDDWMGDIYSIRRRQELAVRTRITQQDDGSIFSEKSYLEDRAASTIGGGMEHRIGQSPWIEGVSVHTLMARALMLRGSSSLEDRIREPTSIWWHSIAGNVQLPSRLPGDVIDCNWQNVILSKAGAQTIDREWVWTEGVDPSWLIFRVVTKFFADELPYSHRWADECKVISPKRMMISVASIVGVSLTPKWLERAADSERAFQWRVSGRSVSVIKMTMRARISTSMFQRWKSLTVYAQKVRAKFANV